MNHLIVSLNNNLEILGSSSNTVGARIIEKLYDLARTGLDNSSTLLGNLLVDKAYGDAVDWLNANTGLNVTVPNGNRYIRFADPEVESLLLGAGIGDGVGITQFDVSLVTTLEDVFDNSNITSFDELLYFTGLRRCLRLFCSTPNLHSTVFPPNLALAINKNYIFSHISSDINIDWNGTTINVENAWYGTPQIYWYCTGLTWKDSLIPPMTDFSQIYFFTGCTAIEKIIIREGVEKVNTMENGCTSLEYYELPSTVTDMGDVDNLFRDGRVPVMVIKAVLPPRWVYYPNNTGGFGWGATWGRLPSAIYVPDNSVTAYKSVSPITIGSGTWDPLTVWSYSGIIDKIKPLSELPQQYREMGTVTQEDIDRV